MMDIGRMGMAVLNGLVDMRMTVFAEDRFIVMMIMMSVIVAMFVFMDFRQMSMKMSMLLGNRKPCP